MEVEIKQAKPPKSRCRKYPFIHDMNKGDSVFIIGLDQIEFKSAVQHHEKKNKWFFKTSKEGNGLRIYRTK